MLTSAARLANYFNSWVSRNEAASATTRGRAGTVLLQQAGLLQTSQCHSDGLGASKRFACCFIAFGQCLSMNANIIKVTYLASQSNMHPLLSHWGLRQPLPKLQNSSCTYSLFTVRSTQRPSHLANFKLYLQNTPAPYKVFVHISKALAHGCH